MDNKNAILFGNGLNLLSEKSISWNDLLKRLSALDKMPSYSNTLNYECIYLTCVLRKMFARVNEEL